jgi:8-oxo-dGTP pyrophosphatase MutT (NUDIX family)
MDHLSRVYLTKRPKTMKFFGGFYVFPDGAVEKADYAIDSQFIKNRKPDISFNQAHYVAAAKRIIRRGRRFTL